MKRQNGKTIDSFGRSCGYVILLVSWSWACYTFKNFQFSIFILILIFMHNTTTRLMEVDPIQHIEHAWHYYDKYTTLTISVCHDLAWKNCLVGLKCLIILKFLTLKK